MSFCGKKYRRVRCENIEELLRASKEKRCTLSGTQSTTERTSNPGHDRGACGTFPWKLGADMNEDIIRMLQLSTPIFYFTRIDETSFQLTVQMDEFIKMHNFKLDEESVVERRDGTKIRVKYTLESDNVLKQVITQPDGKIAYFKREFGDKETKMTVTMEGVDVEAVIYYETVE